MDILSSSNLPEHTSFKPAKLCRILHLILFSLFVNGLYSQCMQPLPVNDLFTDNEVQFSVRLSYTNVSPDCHSDVLPAYFWYHRNAASAQNKLTDGNECTIWPNPAENWIHLGYQIPVNGSNSVTMTNLNNQIVKKWILDGDNRFYVGDMPPSCYFLRVANTQGETLTTKKIILCR